MEVLGIRVGWGGGVYDYVGNGFARMGLTERRLARYPAACWLGTYDGVLYRWMDGGADIVLLSLVSEGGTCPLKMVSRSVSTLPSLDAGIKRRCGRLVEFVRIRAESNTREFGWSYPHSFSSIYVSMIE